MGLNTSGQLGIDRNLNQALQPMLVKALDNKIITQICVGQHHNAVVADGILYTWGWNIYGQLGHCNITTVREPKVVEFFKNKVSFDLTNNSKIDIYHTYIYFLENQTNIIGTSAHISFNI